jgi:hypothetical protein
MEMMSDGIVAVDRVEMREVLDCRELLTFGGLVASNFFAKTKNGQFGSRLSCSFLFYVSRGWRRLLAYLGSSFGSHPPSDSEQ